MSRLARKRLTALKEQSGQINIWITDTNFVVFGAILSAYAGVKISNLPDSIENAFMIILLCFLHVMFLIASLVFASQQPRLSLQSKIIFGSLTAVSMFLAGLVWRATFPDYFIYSGILVGWFLCQFGLSSVVNKVVLKLTRVLLNDQRKTHIVESAE